MTNDLAVFKTFNFVYEHRLSPQQAKIWAFANNRESIIIKDVVRTVNVSRQRATTLLDSLCYKGLLAKRRQIEGNYYRYYIQKRVS